VLDFEWQYLSTTSNVQYQAQIKAVPYQESNVQLKQNFGDIQATESDITDF
jgi:hypothetical protein